MNWEERSSINNDKNLKCLIISQLPEAYRQKADCYGALMLLRLRNIIYNKPTKLTITDVAAITLTNPGSAIHLSYSDFPPRDCNSYEVRFERKDVIEWMKQKKRYRHLAQSLDQIDYAMVSETTAKEVKMKKTIIITWESLEDGFTLNLPVSPTDTTELVGVLEMCKMIVFENRQQKVKKEEGKK